MAKVEPFRALKYSPAIPLDKVVTQPYDKISKQMQDRYYAMHPQNIVRVVLGRTSAEDSDGSNPYTRAAEYLREWRASGVLRPTDRPAFFAYFQRFTIPGTREQHVRKGFIGLGRLEDYESKIVFPHERTLTGPKEDRLQLLRHTRTHFEQIFMLYEDPAQRIDQELDRAAARQADMQAADEYGVEHRLWILDDPSVIDLIKGQMADKKLIIADGHHRYETALTYRKESGAQFMPMTFFNMHSPGLTILPTHRVLAGLKNFSSATLLEKSREFFDIKDAPDDPEQFRAALRDAGQQQVTIGVCIDEGRRHALLSLKPSVPVDLDVLVLHRLLIERIMGISEEAVRKESHITYVREFDSALAAVREGKAQGAFLLNPTRLDQMRDVAYAGQVMPQKSTDFYPKILSGLVMYPLE